MKYERLTNRNEEPFYAFDACKECEHKDACWDYNASNCKGCTVGEKFSRLTRQNKKLKAENAALRERLEKAVELENKINNGELVDAIWFKSWVNGQICCGSVIGYSDGCFVIACGDDLISANKIYTSREQARYELDKKINKKEE